MREPVRADRGHAILGPLDPRQPQASPTSLRHRRPREAGMNETDLVRESLGLSQPGALDQLRQLSEEVAARFRWDKLDQHSHGWAYLRNSGGLEHFICSPVCRRRGDGSAHRSCGCRAKGIQGPHRTARVGDLRLPERLCAGPNAPYRGSGRRAAEGSNPRFWREASCVSASA